MLSKIGCGVCKCRARVVKNFWKKKVWLVSSLFHFISCRVAEWGQLHGRQRSSNETGKLKLNVVEKFFFFENNEKDYRTLASHFSSFILFSLSISLDSPVVEALIMFFIREQRVSCTLHLLHADVESWKHHRFYFLLKWCFFLVWKDSNWSWINLITFWFLQVVELRIKLDDDRTKKNMRFSMFVATLTFDDKVISTLDGFSLK